MAVSRQKRGRRIDSVRSVRGAAQRNRKGENALSAEEQTRGDLYRLRPVQFA